MEDSTIRISNGTISVEVKHRCFEFESGERDWIVWSGENDISKVEIWYMNYIGEYELPRSRMKEADYFELLVVDEERQDELEKKNICSHECNTHQDSGRFLMPLYEHINRWSGEVPDVAFSTCY